LSVTLVTRCHVCLQGYRPAGLAGVALGCPWMHLARPVCSVGAARLPKGIVGTIAGSLPL